MIQFQGSATPTDSWEWHRNSKLKLGPGRVSGVARFNRSGHLSRSGLRVVFRGEGASRDARMTFKFSTDLVK